jgi:hypothetical protein
MEKDYLDVFGRNIDAALDIGDPAVRLAGMAKGLAGADGFFAQYEAHDILGSHRDTGRFHVSVLDDHDMVGRPVKARFAAADPAPGAYSQAAAAVGIQLATLGVPCIYYGTEQAFDGSQFDGDPGADAGFEDRYIREGMFGSVFGAFRTSGCHFFDPDHPAYRRIAAIAGLRGRADRVGLALRRGRQYPRPISFLNRPFGFYGPGELAAWSRVLYDRDVLTVLNTHGTEPRGAWVTVDAGLHPAGSRMTILYHSGMDVSGFAPPPGQDTVEVLIQNDGRSAVRVDLPASGMMILA